MRIQRIKKTQCRLWQGRNRHCVFASGWLSNNDNVIMFAFAQRSGAMKSPMGTLSDRAVSRQRDGGACPGRTLSAGCDTAGAAQAQAVFKKLRILPEEQQNTRLCIVCKAQYMSGCGFVVVCSHCQNRSKHNFCGAPSSRYRIERRSFSASACTCVACSKRVRKRRYSARCASV